MPATRAVSIVLLLSSSLAADQKHRLRKATARFDLGNPRCPCVGFDDTGSKVTVPIGDGPTDYPRDLGSRCEAWDDGRSAESCMDEDQEPGKGQGWCAQSWCYVDPCNCDIEVLPKVSFYMPEATLHGKAVFFSYATCGGHDSYTAEEAKTACVHQALPTECAKLEDCSWTGSRCVTKAIAEKCEAELTPKYFQSEADCHGDDVECQEFKAAQGSVLAAEQALHSNIVETRELKATLAKLDDKEGRSAQIQRHEAVVAQEAQSPKLAGFLGDFWREMRVFHEDGYRAHVKTRLADLKGEKPDLEKALRDAKASLADVKEETALKADIDKAAPKKALKVSVSADEEDEEDDDDEGDDSEPPAHPLAQSAHNTRRQWKDLTAGRTGGGDRDGYYPVDLTPSDDGDAEQGDGKATLVADKAEDEADAPAEAAHMSTDDEADTQPAKPAAKLEMRAAADEAPEPADAAASSMDATQQQLHDLFAGKTGGSGRSGVYPVDLVDQK